MGSVGGQGLSDLVAQLVGASTPGMCRAERDKVRSLINTIYLVIVYMSSLSSSVCEFSAQ